VHLEPAEIATLREAGSHVAHCPSSNLKLASSIAPLSALRSADVNVGLGTDGAASNNRLDLFEEMRTAALIAKGVSGNPTGAPAAEVLSMATLGGARALGLDRQIGSIEAGKWADLAAVNLDALELSPCYHPISHLVYAAGRQHVSHVWVAGRMLLDDGRLTTLDEAELRARSASWEQRIRPQA
jgi:5-methylthioadenosine/S-adenosylhomocysteine deaminase